MVSSEYVLVVVGVEEVAMGAAEETMDAGGELSMPVLL